MAKDGSGNVGARGTFLDGKKVIYRIVLLEGHRDPASCLTLSAKLELRLFGESVGNQEQTGNGIKYVKAS